MTSRSDIFHGCKPAAGDCLTSLPRSGLALLTLIFASCLVGSPVIHAQEVISGPNMNTSLIGHNEPNAFYDPVAAHTIDPDSGHRDAGRIEVDPSRIVTLNDYAPNQGPADFYRNENNFYRNLGDTDTVMQPGEALAPGSSSQISGGSARTTPPIASTAYAQYYASTFMDFDAAVALGNKINSTAKSSAGTSGPTPQVSLGDVARALRAERAVAAPQTASSPQAAAQPAKTVTAKIVVNQDDRGQLQICGADGTSCRGLK